MKFWVRVLVDSVLATICLIVFGACVYVLGEIAATLLA